MGYDSHETVDVGGRAVAYHETGSGEPLLLHHGGESHKGQYAIFAPHLADGIRAISYDQREVGDAGPTDSPYEVGDLADDCVGLMDALGIDRAHVMGISFGGAIAMHVGLRHPDRVRSLVIGAAPDSFQRPSPFVEQLMSATPEQRAQAMLGASLSPEAQQDEALMATLDGLVRGRVTLPGSYRAEAIRGHHLTADDLGRITAPTLLVYGELDPIVPPDIGRLVQSLLPDSELIVVPGARHGLSFEFRQLLGDLVSRWVLDRRGDA